MAPAAFGVVAGGGVGASITDPIAQHGAGNLAEVFQRGHGNSGTITQTGDNNAYALFQFGRKGQSTIQQTGNGKAGITLQGNY